MIYLDLTEFLHRPLRTGIQRVNSAFLQNWQMQEPLQLFLIHRGQAYAVPGEFRSYIVQFFSDDKCGVERFSVTQIVEKIKVPISLEEFRQAKAILNLELFGDQGRVQYYENLIENGLKSKIFFLVYDMLPWVHPSWFETNSVLGMMDYLHLLRNLDHLAFISEQSRQDCFYRVFRRIPNNSAVIPLGSDCFGKVAPKFDPKKKKFIMVGTLEPRKNIEAALDAFTEILPDHPEVEFQLIGRFCQLSTETKSRLDSLVKNCSQFTWDDHPDDQMLYQSMLSARAMIYPSWCEGFGLPPMESLALGIPVIVGEHIPSIQMIDSFGQIRVKTPDPHSIKQAMLQMLDDDFAKNKTMEIKKLKLPLWQDVPRKLLDWIQQCQLKVRDFSRIAA